VKIGKIDINRLFTNIIFILIIVFTLCIYLIPILSALNVAFKTEKEFINNPVGLFESLNIDNFTKALKEANFLTYFFNSVWYCFGSGLISLAICLFAAYPIARDYIKFGNVIYAIFLAGWFLPDPLIPQYQLMLRIGLYNNPFGYILLKSSVGISFLLFVGYIKSIPRSYDEAAGIEGCGVIQYLYKVLIPLCKPVIATGFILHIIPVWNDIIGSTIFLTSPNLYPVVRALFAFMGQYGNNWPPLVATMLLVAAPIIVLYIFLQNYIIEGMATSGIKG
jgi:raffinose/stachyose/melibiose transport system permease protein